MLVNLKEILKIAEADKIAVGMFNATGFDSLQAVISGAEELNKPVIIAHAEVHNVYNDISMVGPAMVAMAHINGALYCTLRKGNVKGNKNNSNRFSHNVFRYFAIKKIRIAFISYSCNCRCSNNNDCNSFNTACSACGRTTNKHKQ